MAGRRTVDIEGETRLLTEKLAAHRKGVSGSWKKRIGTLALKKAIDDLGELQQSTKKRLRALRRLAINRAWTDRKRAAAAEMKAALAR